MNLASDRQFNAPKWIWLAYVVFVVYGSLVPLDFHHKPLDVAWAAFQDMPFLQLGLKARADWVANGVLYFPVGFLAAHILTRPQQGLSRIVGLAGAMAFCAAMAIGVEFAQIFFPPRTVSLNDLLAEIIGSAVGVAAASRYANWYEALIRSLAEHSGRLAARLVEAYAFVYLAVAFFPYDLLLSRAELLGKLHSTGWGWLVVADSPRLSLIALQFLLELVLTVPIGPLLVRLAGHRHLSYPMAALAGFLLGATIEFGQFFIASGVSQGLSAISRTLGVCLGLAIYRRRERLSAKRMAFHLKRFAPACWGVYLVALASVNGWFVLQWQGLDSAMATLRLVHFMPFYYHYYTTEAKALFSFAIVCLSYAPLGVLGWAGGWSRWFTLALSLALAVCIETSKLFLKGAHPDPTNILQAGFVVWITMWTIGRFTQGGAQNDYAQAPGAPANAEPPANRTPFTFWLFCALVAMAGWLLMFPVFPLALLIIMVLGIGLVWLRPASWFALVPAGLPALDLAPWSGRFFLDEFDVFLLTCSAVASVRLASVVGAQRNSNRAWHVAALALGISLVTSAILGLVPLQMPDANAFNHYYSPYNALRILKGAAWAVVFCLLARRAVAGGIDVGRWFAWGLIVGLAFTVAVVLWERVAFSGLWNFTEGYRVTGPFSAMHVGGAFIECFLAVAAPFLIFQMVENRNVLLRLAGFGLLVVTTYALMVTYSRNGYSAFVVGVVAVLAFSLRRSKRRFRSLAMATGLFASLLVVAVPIFQSGFAQARMATVKADLDVRAAHWRSALSLRDSGLSTHFFGMGLGRFPATSFWRGDQSTRSGTYHLASEPGNSYLRLGSGDSIYVEQFVDVKPGQGYLLKLDVRPHIANASVTVPICEKWMLTSYNCIWHTFALGKEFGDWRSFEARVSSKAMLDSPWYSKRPVKLALYYPTPKSTVDIDNVRLEAENGSNLVRNGDFSKGLDQWFNSTDGHLQWHIKSLFVGVLFDQGWIGLTAWFYILALALAAAWKNAVAGDGSAAPAIAALMSFLVVGVFDTLIDSPRFLMLLLILIWLCAQPGKQLGKPK